MADDFIKPILQSKEDGKKPDDNMLRRMSRQTYQFWQSWDQLELKDGTIYHKYEDNLGKTQQDCKVFVRTSVQDARNRRKLVIKFDHLKPDHSRK